MPTDAMSEGPRVPAAAGRDSRGPLDLDRLTVTDLTLVTTVQECGAARRALDAATANGTPDGIGSADVKVIVAPRSSADGAGARCTGSSARVHHAATASRCLGPTAR